MTGTASHDDSVAALRRLADAHADVGRWAEALECYAQLFARDGTDVYSACRIVDALRALRRTGDAVAAAERAVEQFPDASSAYNALANAYDSAGRAAVAVTAFRRAIELEPNAAYLHRNLARVAWKVPDFPTAIAAARRGLELTPQQPQSFQALGYVLLQAGEPVEAAQWLEQGLGLDPENTVMMNNLGRAYAAAGDLDRAADLFRGVIRIRPQDDETSRELLSVMVRQQSAEADGIAAARDAVHRYLAFYRRLDLDTGVADHVVANCLRHGSDLLDGLGDHEGALAVALDAVAHADAVAAGGRTRYGGTAVTCRCAVARLQTRLAQHDEAVATAREAVAGARTVVERHPVDEAHRVPEGLYQLAQSLGAAGALDESAAAAAACVAASDDLPPTGSSRAWWQRWSRCLCSDRLAAVGRLDDAIVMCREAVDVARATWEERGAGEQRRAYADELGHLADHLLAADRPADALAAVSDAIEHYRDVVADRPEHRCWLDEKLVKAGNCYVRLGRAAEARLVLEEAIASLEAAAGSGCAVSMQDQSASTDDEPGQWLAEARSLLASL